MQKELSNKEQERLEMQNLPGKEGQVKSLVLFRDGGMSNGGR